MTDMRSDQTEPQADVELLDEQARLSRLVLHLSTLVNRGGRVEEQHGYRAMVLMPNRQQWLPNAVMSAIAIALFLWTSDPLFLVAGAVALLGWHKKLVAGAERIRVMVRVDDAGEVSERVLGAA